MPSVAVIEAVPAKLGEDIVPLPESVAELVVIVYVPAGRAWPLSMRRRLYRERDRDVARDGRDVVLPVTAHSQAGLGGGVERQTSAALNGILTAALDGDGNHLPVGRGQPDRPRSHRGAPAFCTFATAALRVLTLNPLEAPLFQDA